MNLYPNPWDFHNTDKKLVSYNGEYRLEYYNLNEIAMGAPIGGKCFIITKENRKFKIGDWVAGPPVWESRSNLVAVPIWTRTFLKGTVQKIVIADLKARKLITFSEIFDVLDLKSFDNNLLYGCDSPVYQKKDVVFDLLKAKIENVSKLEYWNKRYI
jgi:hypothetical protein